MKLAVQQWHLEVADLLPAKLNARSSFLLAREHATESAHVNLYCHPSSIVSPSNPPSFFFLATAMRGHNSVRPWTDKTFLHSHVLRK